MTQPRIQPLSLRFENNHTEQEYRKWRLGMDAKFLTYISFFGLVVQIAYSVRGIANPSAYTDLSQMIRLYYLAPVFIIACLILLFVRPVVKEFKLFSIVSLVLVFSLTTTQLIFGYLDVENLSRIYSSGLLLVILAVALFSGLPFFWLFLYLPVVVAVSLIITATNMPIDQTIEVALVDCISLVIALSAAYFIEFRNRLLYLKKQEIAGKSDFKTTLLSVLAHDVRRPLGNLGSTINLINSGQLTVDERKSLMTVMAADFTRISSMTEEILTWIKSQFDGATITNHWFNAHDLADQVIRAESAEASKKGIVVTNHVAQGCQVHGAPEIIKIILRNTLTNSIKYCRRGDVIDVSINETNEAMAFVVRDTGPGFDAPSPEKVSGGLDSRLGTSGEKGFGMGLKICQDLLYLVNSKLEISSQKGVGTSVAFSFLKKSL